MVRVLELPGVTIPLSVREKLTPLPLCLVCCDLSFVIAISGASQGGRLP